MDELCRELSACLAPESSASGARTMVVPARKRQRPPAARPSIWPLILLLAGLTVLAGILAAVFAFTDSGNELSTLVGKKKHSTTPSAGPIRITSASAYDPYGDQTEHDAQARFAIDGDPGTYWNTEHYSGGLRKPGVGLVLDVGSARRLSRLVVRTDTQGFTAKIESGSSAGGPFATVSSSLQVGGNTTFALKDGPPRRYYLVWITDLGSNSSVEINEVSARGR